jgi:hypothetical protein
MLIATLFVTILIATSCGTHPKPAGGAFVESKNADSIQQYGIIELLYKHNGRYDNNFLDVTLSAVFISPSGVQRRVKGFYYGGDLWKIRFRPDEIGRWTYIYVMNSKTGFHQEGKGEFNCIHGDEEGPIRHHPENHYRWVFGNGKPYFPVGLQNCISARGSQLEGEVIDGGTREEGGRLVSFEEYFSIYGEGGFNLFRFSQKNCSYFLYDDLNHYREGESLATDELLSLARRHGFRVMFGFFGYHGSVTQGNRYVNYLKHTLNKLLGTQEEAIQSLDDRETIAKEKRFIEYAVARWGVYVDFWELLNERAASDEWTTMMADFVRSVDPDRKPISTSWEKPHLPAIDINAPHWYESESEFQSDLRVVQLANKWKQMGKPVIVGEHGNTGMNWDPLSGLRMRIRTWTALFQEISLIFWDTSWSKAGMHRGHYTPGAVANIYLGPEERGYIRVLQNFSAKLDSGVRMATVEVFPSDRVRGYGLLSKTVAAAYLHHIDDHTTTLRNVKIRLDLPGNAHSKKKLVGEWIEPSTGKVIARLQAAQGQRTLDVPPFTIDLALLITSIS